MMQLTCTDVQPPDMDDDDALAARFESFIAQDADSSDAAMDTDDPSSTPTGPAAPMSPSDALVRSTLASACPSCGAPPEASSMATAPDALGVPSVGCRACHWSLPLHVLDDAAIRFQSLCVAICTALLTLGDAARRLRLTRSGSLASHLSALCCSARAATSSSCSPDAPSVQSVQHCASSFMYSHQALRTRRRPDSSGPRRDLAEYQ